MKNDFSSNKKSIVVFAMVSLFLMFEMAMQVSPSVMASDLMKSLNMTAFSLGIMSSVYFYSYTAMQIPSGLLFDKFNARVIITCAVMICSIGAILFGSVTNFYLGCLARLLMGVGSAFAFVSVLVMASRLFDAKWFPLLTGITQMLAAVGAMCGQLPIRVLINAAGWRETMYFLGVFGILLSFLIFWLVNHDKYKKNNEMLISYNKSINIKSSLKSIIRNSQTWFTAGYACLLWAPMSAFASLWGVPFLEKFDGLSANHAAFYCSLMWLGLALGSPVLGVFSTITRNKITPLKLSALIGIISFYFTLYFHMNGLLLGLCLFFSGAACAGQALSFGLVKDNNLEKVRGTAIAFNNMAVVFSGVIFQPLVGYLLKTVNPHSAFNFQFSLSVILCAYIIGFLITFLMVNRKKKQLGLSENNYTSCKVC